MGKDASRPLIIAVIVGTARAQRESIKAAHFVAEQVQKREGVEMIFVDPRDFSFPDDGDEASERDPRYSEITAKADAFYIVTPEYNHAYPGSLKRMLDSEYDNYFHKAVAIAGVSSGMWGGVRVVEALLAPLHRIGLHATWHECYFPHIQDMFGAKGVIRPEFAERQTKTVNKQLDELIWLATILRDGRQTVPKA
jgi:NAD(P)H-dependent FMN reductase